MAIVEMCEVDCICCPDGFHNLLLCSSDGNVE